VVVTVAKLLVKTARNSFPFCADVAVKLYVVEVAPLTLLNVTPPSVLTCHCTSGVGTPLAAALKLAVFPALTVSELGLVVIVAAESTVSVAAVVVAVPALFVNTARNSFAFCAAAAVKPYVAEVAPFTLLKVVPPSVLTCHCTVGVGVPLAAAVKLAGFPALTASELGLVVIVGATFTVSVAAVVVAVPKLFVNTARNLFPFCPAVAVKLYVAEVAPLTLLNVVPPSVLTCHCTVGAGVPLAAAVKLTLPPAVTVWFAGFVVTVGAEFTGPVPPPEPPADPQPTISRHTLSAQIDRKTPGVRLTKLDLSNISATSY